MSISAARRLGRERNTVVETGRGTVVAVWLCLGLQSHAVALTRQCSAAFRGTPEEILRILGIFFRPMPQVSPKRGWASQQSRVLADVRHFALGSLRHVKEVAVTNPAGRKTRLAAAAFPARPFLSLNTLI